MSFPVVHHTLPLKRIGLPLGIEDLLTGVDSFRIPGVADYIHPHPSQVTSVLMTKALFTPLPKRQAAKPGSCL